MKQSQKLALGIIASLGLGIAVATAHAHPGDMGGGMGPTAGIQHGAQGDMQHGNMGGTENGGMGGAGRQFMTPEGRTALRDRMRNATPEERQKIAESTMAEMQGCAQENGIAMLGHRGPRAGGPRFGPAPQAPSATE